MATVPGPRPDRPLPTPGAPEEAPVEEPVEEPGTERIAQPDWLPTPYDPDREYEEPGVPVAP